MARRLIKAFYGNGNEVKVYFDPHSYEYTCEMWHGGKKHYKPADYFTDDKEDALKTASSMVSDLRLMRKDKGASKIKRNSIKPSHKAPVLRWDTFTGTNERNSYSAHFDGGQYSISPVAGRKNYALLVANQGGLHNMPHSGLWHELGRFASPNAAKAAAKKHYSEHFMIRTNPVKRTIGQPSQRARTTKTGKTTKTPSERLMARRKKDTIPGYYPNPGGGFCKVMFYGAHGKTAGIILPAEKCRKATVSSLSRFFPSSEAMKMERIYVSDAFPTWESAFKHIPKV